MTLELQTLIKIVLSKMYKKKQKENHLSMNTAKIHKAALKNTFIFSLSNL